VYQPHAAQPTFSQRLIVVANRLPVSACKDKHGNWELQEKPHTSDTVLIKPWFRDAPQSCLSTNKRPPGSTFRGRRGGAAAGEVTY